MNTFTKGGLISEVILSLVPLPTKGAKSLLRRKFEFPSKTVNNLLFKFSAQESNLAPFVGDGNKVKITSEIKPPLLKYTKDYSVNWKKIILCDS